MESNPGLAVCPVRKYMLIISLGKVRVLKIFFWTVVAFDRPEPSDLSLRTEEPVRQNLDEKGNIIWARKERKFKKKKEGRKHQILQILLGLYVLGKEREQLKK